VKRDTIGKGGARIKKMEWEDLGTRMGLFLSVENDRDEKMIMEARKITRETLTAVTNSPVWVCLAEYF
jgi:S-ribosylhomocysteine lyase LuxS involved in autoinducer biosynthesis